MNLFAGVSWATFLMWAVPIFLLVQVGLIFLYKFVWKDKEGVESKEKQRLSLDKDEDEQEEPVVLNQNVIMAGDDAEDEVKETARENVVDETELQQKIAMADGGENDAEEDADDSALSDQTADSSDWTGTDDPNDNTDDEMEANFKKSVACQSVETQETDGWGEELIIKGLGAMEKQAIAASGDGDTIVIDAEKVEDMEQQSGKATERGFDLNNVAGVDEFQPVSMLNKLKNVQTQEDMKEMEASEVDVDVEDIPAAPKQIEEDEDEGPEQKDKDI